MNSNPEITIEPLKSVEEEIINGVRDRLTDRAAGTQPDAAGDVNHSIGALIDKVSVTTIAGFEKLISDLEAARNYLKAEGDRIQQDMARYAHLSDTASASVKIISERFGQWRDGGLETRRGNLHAL